MHETLCVCGLVPRLETSTRLVLVVHYREARRTTNTGQLAAACLPNAEVVVTGERGGAPRVEVDPASSALLFPAEDAVPVEELRGRAGLTLVVPDGNWRQAAKARARVPGLAALPCVRIPEGEETRYRLRSEPKPGGLATLEAIARAMGVLEGDEVERAMLEVLDVMVERTLWTRGRLATEDVRGGIPEAALRAFRR
jgi:DTW domain-containing protein YfiP